MNRRNFLKFAGLASAALATVGIRPPATVAGELSTQPKELPSIAGATDFDAVERWYGAIMVPDPNCPPDRIYFMVQTRFHENDLLHDVANRAAQERLQAWTWK